MNDKIVKELIKREKTICVAESLTGGLLASSFVDISGASAVFKGGIVAYMLEIKELLLDVPLSHSILTDGVDEMTAELMAKNACIKMNSDYAISTTGIAEAWDDRSEQAFICVYDKHNDSFLTEHYIFRSESDDKSYMSRDFVRQKCVENALILISEKLGI